MYIKCVEECMARKCGDEGTMRRKRGRSRGDASSFQLALEFRYVLLAVGNRPGIKLWYPYHSTVEFQ